MFVFFFHVFFLVVGHHNQFSHAVVLPAWKYADMYIHVCPGRLLYLFAKMIF